MPGCIRSVAERAREGDRNFAEPYRRIVNNRRRITADTALRRGLYFGNSAEFWLNLQSHYDLKMARRNLKPEDAKRIKAVRAA
ncbi:MAG TPA: HigA family addiction module antitoxin [Bradyrhizobium sp.]|nr:HigA family addiction module antitoxin [Bradyrhizobium sp.]